MKGLLLIRLVKYGCRDKFQVKFNTCFYRYIVDKDTRCLLYSHVYVLKFLICYLGFEWSEKKHTLDMIIGKNKYPCTCLQ